VTDIKQIQSKIKKLYQSREVQPVMNVPPVLQVRQWVSFAKEYIAAASIVENKAPQYYLLILQMTGHAIECSLKACLTAAGEPPPAKHDLINLYQHVEKHGFQLDDPNKAAIVHLHHFYFQDLATETKYKARFPTENLEQLGGSVPSNATFVSIIHSLIKQAEQKIEGNESDDKKRPEHLA